MGERHVLGIPGLPRARGSWEEVTSPYSGEALAEVEQADAGALSALLETQSALFADRGRRLPTHQRISILKRAAGLMRQREEELALLIAREGGKPLADARIEVTRAINGVEFSAEEAGRLQGTEIPMGATPASEGRLAFTTREPIGVVAAVSAFNHPLNLIVHQAAPAVAIGCPVIVKPAEPTPLSCITLIDILHQAGLPPEWCVALPCGLDVAEQLVTSDRIGFFSFIGSARVGWMLRSKLAPGVRCSLEHGGVAPMIVDETADLDLAVPLILKGGYYHAGQVCVSVQRVFVERSRQRELVERLHAGIEELRTGDPTDAGTDVGPLIRASEVERVHEWVEEASGSGATLVCGGKRLPNQCYAPTLLVDPPDGAKVMRLEIFGPVVSVIGFDELDHAIDRANGVPWAFQAAVLTRDLERAIYVSQRLNATAVMVNDHAAFRVDWMPFGGRGASGLGLGGIPYTMHDLTQPKMIVLRA